jgi:hypothetical protein
MENGLQLTHDLLEPAYPVAEPLIDDRLDSVGVEVVANPNLLEPLADAVDAADPLLHSHRIPRHVIVDENTAGLEV